MTLTWDYLIGDARDVLPDLIAQGVRAQCIVTSPPYWGGLRDYDIPDVEWADGWTGQLGQEPSPGEYVEHLLEVTKLLWDILADDGVLWLNIGDCYATGVGTARIPGGGDEGNRWRGVTTQPNRMPIEGLKPKDLVGVPWMVAFAMRSAGWYLRGEIIWWKPNPRTEGVKDRPTRAHEQIFQLTKSRHYYYDIDAVREAFEYEEKRLERIQYNGKSETTSRFHPPNPKGKNIRSVWYFPKANCPDAHFAVFPEELPKRCILASTQPGDLVLDPFAGRGTTIKVARQLRRSAIGIDLGEGYREMAVSIAQLNTPDIQSFLGSMEVDG